MRTMLIGGWIVFQAALASAGFNLPRDAFTADQAERAVETAKREGRPLAFLISDTDTKCPLCEDASKEIIRRMRRTVLVYSRSVANLPESVRTLIQGQNTGRYIPYVIVTDADVSRLLGIVRYEDIKEKKARAFREVEKAIQEYRRVP